MITQSTHRIRNQVLILFFISLIYGLIFYFYFGPINAGDTISYTSIADKIRVGRFYQNQEDIFRPPGYPLFIASILSLAGENYRVIIFFQILLFSLTVVLTYWAAYHAFGEKVARLSGWFVALNPALAYYSVTILSETLSIFLVSLSLFLIIKGIRKQKSTFFLLAGIALAYLLWIKPIGLLLGLFFALAVLLQPKLSGKWVKSFLLILPVISVFFAWSLHNQIKFGSFTYNPIYGLNLLERTIYLNKANIKSPIVQDAYKLYREHEANQTLGPQTDEIYYWWAVLDTSRKYGSSIPLIEKNSQFYDVAIQLIKNDPIGYLEGTSRELVSIWAGYTPNPGKTRPVILEVLSAKDKAWTHLVLGLILGAIMFTLVVLSTIESILKKDWISILYILPSLLIPLLVALISFTGSRYRLLVEPLILTLIAYAIINVRSGVLVTRLATHRSVSRLKPG
jgi:4-amino-4-deoxy-L-arabinose transferase-like glycosyltransferase